MFAIVGFNGEYPSLVVDPRSRTYDIPSSGYWEARSLFGTLCTRNKSLCNCFVMCNFPPLQRFVLASFLCIGQTFDPCSAQDGVLLLDGKVRTKGSSMEGARVVVERNGAPVEVLKEDIGRIHLQLELQVEYKLSFQRKGCMTKELFFDTRVPEDGLEKAPFFFPFLITLEERTLGAEFKYAQPVGYIRYYPDKKDFGYDTNYMLRREQQRKQEGLRRFIEREVALDSVSFSSSSVPETGSKEIRSPGPGGGEGVMGLSPVPEKATTDLKTPRVGPTTSETAFTRAVASARFAGMSEARRTDTTRSSNDHVMTTPLRESVVEPDGREDQVLVEPTYVARVIRITESGHTREYRRVSHRYGATHYFCNGLSCCEEAFQVGALKER